MQIIIFDHIDQLRKDPLFPAMQEGLREWPEDHFFQSPDFLEMIAEVPGFSPFLLAAKGADESYKGSLLAVVQSEGKGPKAWFSRRIIVWGGPALAPGADSESAATTAALLKALKKKAKNLAIYIEFRNFFDTFAARSIFEREGFQFLEHLNLLVPLNDEESTLKRMGRDRRRQIRTSLESGAEVKEAETLEEVREFYEALAKLYRERVKKPLPAFGFFRRLWESPHAKIFVVKYEGKVLGGAAGPVYPNKTIFQWYLCGENGAIKGLHVSVLATWAQIDFGLKNGYRLFDFMGAGKPNEDYGVRTFKASFGCEEVAHGRYECVVRPTLYKIGKLGLKVYSKLS